MAEPTVAFAMTLLRLKGVGRRTVVSVLDRYPDQASLWRASGPELERAVGRRAMAVLATASEREWDDAREAAAFDIERHERAGVAILAPGSLGYPALLGSVPDPPAVLYVRGDVSSLDAPLTVAVVGTREPTARGREVARRVARRFAEAGAVVVSGLAKGIDSAGHEGALEAGRTIAVLGTAIDKVYPAENRDLSRRIESRGALVSEYPIGFPSRSDAFVDRDRLQAGLSVAVIPVQTRIEGGTQHTIKFAIEARRRVLCPRPPDSELDAPQNEGILALLRSGRARPFDADDLPAILEELVAARAGLVAAGPQLAPAPTATTRRKGGKAAKPNSAQMDWLLPQETGVHAQPPPEPPAVHTMDEVVAELDEALDRVGPRYDEAAFDEVVRAWRRRRYPSR